MTDPCPYRFICDQLVTRIDCKPYNCRRREYYEKNQIPTRREG